MNPLHKLLAVCLLLLAPLSGASADAIQGIVAFGDSLTDTGNFAALTEAMTGTAYPVAPYYNGRLSNGPVWLERLASSLGVAAPVAAAQGGLNYATSDAKTGAGFNTGSAVPVPNMGTQIASYLSGHTPAANQLFAVWGGANDFFYNETDYRVPVQNLKDDILALAAAGAKDFLVPNLPMLGETPLIRGMGPLAEAYFNGLTLDFNHALDAMLDTLQATLMGVTLHRMDVAGLFLGIQADPGAYGLTNAYGQAKSGDLGMSGDVVANPNEYLFWDGVHPTAAGHQLIANLALAEVPEPATLALLVLGWPVLLRRKANTRRFR